MLGTSLSLHWQVSIDPSATFLQVPFQSQIEILNKSLQKMSFALDMLQRITFHTGMLEDTLFDVFARTKCQIVIKPEELTPMPMK